MLIGFFLGNRAYGIAAASEVYYGKSVQDLNLAQFAMIASLPKAPSRINPIANPVRSLSRRKLYFKTNVRVRFYIARTI